MRRNVLDWLTGEVKKATQAIVLTHNIDFLFVQSVLARKLRQVGNPKLTIFADAMCAAQSFAGQHMLLDGLGVRYRVVPVELGAGRRFHPKALLLGGPDRAALAIGSGNLTHGGMAANHEAWVFAVSDGEGAPLIAAFRQYLESLLSALPLAESLREEVDLLFDPTQTWVSELPPANGLASSPASVSIFDQIAHRATGNVRSVTVLAPYHDDEGAALGRIAERFPVPVTCLMQSGREGLSKSAATGLPSNVKLKSVDCIESHRPSFIHAKVIALYRDGDIVMAVGSANCSRAGLLADAPTWGNAEFMAIDTVDHAMGEAFFSELVVGNEAPTLPDHPLSDDWETIDHPPLRILAARHVGGRLSVAYNFTGDVTELLVVAGGGSTPAETVDREHRLATFLLPMRPRTVVVRGRTSTGEWLESSEIWVDDDSSLAAPASFRRFFGGMQGYGSDFGDTAGAFQGILELFRDYLRDPEAKRRRLRSSKRSEPPSGPYDPEKVFSGEFERSASTGTVDPMTASTTSVLAIIEALFAVNREVGGVPAPPSDDGESENEAADPAAAKADPIRKCLIEPEEKTNKQLDRALRNMVQTLCEPEFVEARSPGLLGADIALAAILLVKGLADGRLSVDNFRRSTRELWATFFFGEGAMEGAGALQRRLDRMSEPSNREAFEAAMVTPRLSAALAIWAIAEWNAADDASSWFRLSAADLYVRHPWLFMATDPEVVATEIRNMSEALLPSNERLAAVRTWVELVRAGEALRILLRALKETSRDELTAAVKSTSVGVSDLVWVNGRLAFPCKTYSRAKGVKAHVNVVGEQSPAHYVASFLLPVRELVESGVLNLPAAGKDLMLGHVDAMTRLSQNALPSRRP